MSVHASHSRVLIPLWILLHALMPAAGASEAILVADLATTASSSGSASPNSPVELDGFVYFAATNPLSGTELWRSDGTEPGTEIVLDLCPGPCDAVPVGLRVIGDRVVFFASDGVFGRELWATDGTRQGTTLVRDICLGPCSSGLRVRDATADRFAVVAGQYYFVAGDGVHEGLWRSDGTRFGTRRVVDFCPGPCSGAPRRFSAAESQLFFQVSRWLWRTDGSAEGTLPLAELFTGINGSIPSTQRVLGNEVLVRVFRPEHGSELWRSDGTTRGTDLLIDLCPGECSGFNGDFLGRHAGELYFLGDAGAGRQVFRTDGSAEGTEIFPFPPATVPRVMATFEDQLFFSGSGGLWASDATPSSLRQVAEVSALTMTVARDRLFFVADNAPQALWASDGTSQGTRELRIFGSSVWTLIGTSQRFFFSTFESGSGQELWASDATAAGTRLVRDIHADPGSSYPERLADAGGRLVFNAQTGRRDPAVWSSDGTPGGAVRLSPGPRRALTFFPNDSGVLYAAEYDNSGQGHVTGLWTTDGTLAGTRLLLDVDLVEADRFTSVGPGELFFSATPYSDRFVDRELWFTDLTEGGTHLVKDIAMPALVGPPPPSSSDVRGLTPVAGGVVFAAARNIDGITPERELWFSDGTEAGTVELLDICDGCSSSPAGLTLLGDRVVFAATDVEAGREPWISDGTTAGTSRLADLVAGAESSSPHDFCRLGDALFFFARLGASRGEALWKSDGTPDGTVRVKELTLKGFPTFVLSSQRVGDRLFFAAANELTGAELWISDGTAEGTRLVKKLAPGTTSSFPSVLTAIDGVLVFAASDGESGQELWMSDGTAEGTRRLADVAPGPLSSAPEEINAVGPWIFFRADDGSTGRELWAIPRDLLAARGAPGPTR